MARILAVLALLAACAPADGPPAEEPSVTDAVPAAASATLEPKSGAEARGKVTLEERDGRVRIRGDITGLTPGAHGLHVHEIGDCSAPDAASAGGHFSPEGGSHGAPGQGHAGDLGNVTANADGVAHIDVSTDQLSIDGPRSVVGRALVVHAAADDLATDPAGGSGDRVACAVIEGGGGA